MRIILRPANFQDFDLTFRIKRNSIKPYVEQIWGWNQVDQYDYHRQNFAPKRTQIIGNSQEEFGLFEIEENNDTIFLINILIENIYQGKGIGSQIIAQIIQTAISKQKALQLEVFKINRRATELYQKLGFKIIEEKELKWVMRLNLPSD